MDFGEKIKALRLKRDMTLEDVGQIVGVGKSTVRKWENGDIKNMRRDKIALLAMALSVSPGYLMGWEAESTVEPLESASHANIDIAPDYEKPALKATEILLKHKINSVPILPMSILQAMPNVMIVTFTEFADKSGMDRSNMVTMFGAENQDVITYANGNNYCVAYNQRLPYYMLQRAMARELGHIVLGHHTSSLPWEIRATEALFFMRYLLCPRPLIKALFDEGIIITVETLGNITGLYGRSLAGIRETPGAHIPARMNKKIRDQFSGYIGSITEYMQAMPKDNGTNPADFGTFMDGYEE